MITSKMESFCELFYIHEEPIIRQYFGKSKHFYSKFIIWIYSNVLAVVFAPAILNQLFLTNIAYLFDIYQQLLKFIIFIHQEVIYMQVGSQLCINVFIAMLIWFTSTRFYLLYEELQIITDIYSTKCVWKHQKLLKYLQKQAHILHELQEYHLGLNVMGTFVSDISTPKKRDNVNDILITIAFLFSSALPVPSQHWQLMVATFNKLQCKSLFNVLQDIEQFSLGESSILELIIHNITELLILSQSNIRNPVHTLLSRALKRYSLPSASILLAFQRCLHSNRTDIFLSALAKLSDIVLCMQEYALLLIKKVFELGINWRVEHIFFHQ